MVDFPSSKACAESDKVLLWYRGGGGGGGGGGGSGAEAKIVVINLHKKDETGNFVYLLLLLDFR